MPEISSIGAIIAAVNPKLYCKSPDKLKELIAEKGLTDAIEEISKPGASIEPKPSMEFKLNYNSSIEGLEPVYFWILDFLSAGGAVEKLIDTFSSSVGSGHFSELMGKGTRMQEESMKIMQTIGVLIKSIINIVYDLRQFKIRLNDYAASKSKDKNTAEAGLLSLKQVWLDNVDIKRGNTSIKAMAFSQASFATLIDAFMFVKSLEQIKSGLDLNERVLRVLEQRFIEFEQWKKLSGKELEKRYNIEKSYLKSQVDSLKLYSRWAMPYLKAAEELKMSSKLGGSASLVKAFNTILLQLTIMQNKKIKVADAILSKDLPPDFDRIKNLRDYFSCVLVDFKFRGIPQKVDQHYAFGGKVEVTFSSYALNQDEIDLMKSELDKSDLKKSFKLIESATNTSLKEIQADIDSFLNEKEGEESEEAEEEKMEEEKKNADVNPFTALLGINDIKNIFKTEKKEKKSEDPEKEKEKLEEKERKRLEKLAKDMKPDNYAEKVIRAQAEIGAIGMAFATYDVYKKAHGMASVPFDLSFSKRDISVSFKEAFQK